MTYKNVPTWAFLTCLVISIVSVELLLSFQGLDLCDEGWVLSAYQQFFKHPDTTQYQFMYYNSLVIGAFWNSLFGQYGIVGFRLLDTLFIVMTSITVYYMLRDVVNRWHVLIGTIACILLRDWGSFVFNHNSISALLSVLSACFILKGMQRNSLMLLFAAFVVIGINIFSRLPNVTMLGLGLLLFVDFYYRKDFRYLLRQVVVCVVGFIAGVGMVLLAMQLTGELHYFKEALADLSSAGHDKESTHQLPYMLKVYAGHYYIILKFSIQLIVPGVCFFFVLKRVTALTKILLSLFIFFVYVFLLFRWQDSFLIAYSMIIIILVAAIFRYRKDSNIVLACTAALIIANFLPLGSDYGINNTGYVCLWTSVPLAISMALKYIRDMPQRLNFEFKIMVIAVFSTFMLKQAITISQTAYFDYGSRFEKRFSINNPLATTYTTERKAAIINELLAQLSRYVKPDDYLLCFQSLPMMNYLTATRPYLGNSWVWSYGPSLMAQKFRAAKASIPGLPVILREKCQPLSGKWTIPVKDYAREDLPTTYEYKGEKIKLINNFQKQNGYTVAWENDLFQILVPPSL